MRDTWRKPHTGANGGNVAGAAAREARIADQGGTDQITTKREMRGFASGYRACKEDPADRLDSVEARVDCLEKN